jgi:hypothetical protein
MNYSMNTNAIQIRYRNPNDCDALSFSLGLGLGIIIWTHVIGLLYTLLYSTDPLNEEVLRLRKLSDSLQRENIEMREDLEEKEAQMSSLRATFARYRNSATRFLESLPDSDSDSD